MAELRELAKIYEHRGVEPGLARLVAEQLMAHDELGAHMRDELGITEIALARARSRPPALRWSRSSSGAVLPLLAVTLAPIDFRIIVTAIVALIALVGLGALSAVAGGARWTRARAPGGGVVVARNGHDLGHRSPRRRARRRKGHGAVPLRSRHLPRDDPHRGPRLRHAAVGDRARARASWHGAGAPRVLDLGAGTGSTSSAVLRAQPDAQLVLVDENPGMLEVAARLLPEAHIERVVDRRSLRPAPRRPVRPRRLRARDPPPRRPGEAGAVRRDCTIVSARGRRVRHGRRGAARRRRPTSSPRSLPATTSRTAPTTSSRGCARPDSEPSRCGRRPISPCSSLRPAGLTPTGQSMRRISAR